MMVNFILTILIFFLYACVDNSKKLDLSDTTPENPTTPIIQPVERPDSYECPSSAEYTQRLHFFDRELFFFQAGRTDQLTIRSSNTSSLDELLNLFDRCSNKAIEDFRDKEKV